MASRVQPSRRRASRRLDELPGSHQSLLEHLAQQLLSRDPTGTIVGRSDDLGRLAEETANGLLDSSAAWVEHLGPFYDGEAVRSLLGRDGQPVSRQAVHKRRGLLALTTGSGQIVYPVAQFRNRRPAPGLADVLDVLSDELVSRWTVASWLFSPEAELDGERPIDLLHDCGPEGAIAVLAAARRWGAQLGAAV